MDHQNEEQIDFNYIFEDYVIDIGNGVVDFWPSFTSNVSSNLVANIDPVLKTEPINTTKIDDMTLSGFQQINANNCNFSSNKSIDFFGHPLNSEPIETPQSSTSSTIIQNSFNSTQNLLIEPKFQYLKINEPLTSSSRSFGPTYHELPVGCRVSDSLCQSSQSMPAFLSNNLVVSPEMCVSKSRAVSNNLIESRSGVMGELSAHSVIANVCANCNNQKTTERKKSKPQIYTNKGLGILEAKADAIQEVNSILKERVIYLEKVIRIYKQKLLELGFNLYDIDNYLKEELSKFSDMNCWDKKK